MFQDSIIVIGAGLAGSEAAYQIAKRGHKVTLYEMRPTTTEVVAHHSNKYGELVCSNSLKNKGLDNAAGLLKEEMRHLDSLIMKSADSNEVPAGNALAVDRESFSDFITNEIQNNPLIEVIHEEIKEIPLERIVIVATGPLTSSTLGSHIASLLGEKSYYFYDAAAPIIDIENIDFNKAYRKSRYDKGGADYINCAFTKDEFFAFYQELINAETVQLKEFEKEIFFEGCMPVEVMAKRGFKTLTFGPLKPVGLERPDGSRPFAVVQLRQDNVAGNLYNLVGFQTNLTFKEQKRVFSMIPGLENVNFVKYGVMHRNTYICAPKHLNPTLSLKANPNVFIAGQISGVEGYIESAATGILAAINAVRLKENKELLTLPLETMLGSLVNYITSASIKNFQPMNSNYGILFNAQKDRLENARISLEALEKWKETIN